MGYSQLTQEQRYVIKVLNQRGETQEDIGDEIGVDKSTISRELDRNEGQRGYRYKQAPPACPGTSEREARMSDHGTGLG